MMNLYLMSYKLWLQVHTSSGAQSNDRPLSYLIGSPIDQSSIAYALAHGMHARVTWSDNNAAATKDSVLLF